MSDRALDERESALSDEALDLRRSAPLGVVFVAAVGEKDPTPSKCAAPADDRGVAPTPRAASLRFAKFLRQLGEIGVREIAQHGSLRLDVRGVRL